MADMSFQDILNQPLDNIETPKAAPIGTYIGMVDGQPEFVKVGQNQTDAVNFNIKLMSAMKVDDAQLNEYLNGSSLTEKHIRHRLFLTKDSAYRLKRFLVNDLGIQFGEGTSLGQAIPEAMGKQFVLELGHQSSQDGQQIFNVVKSTAKV
jgi:hypothetical protein